MLRPQGRTEGGGQSGGKRGHAVAKREGGGRVSGRTKRAHQEAARRPRTLDEAGQRVLRPHVRGVRCVEPAEQRTQERTVRLVAEFPAERLGHRLRGTNGRRERLEQYPHAARGGEERAPQQGAERSWNDMESAAPRYEQRHFGWREQQLVGQAELVHEDPKLRRHAKALGTPLQETAGLAGRANYAAGPCGSLEHRARDAARLQPPGHGETRDSGSHDGYVSLNGLAPRSKLPTPDTPARNRKVVTRN